MSGKWISFNCMTERWEFLYVKIQYHEMFQTEWTQTKSWLQESWPYKIK